MSDVASDGHDTALESVNDTPPGGFARIAAKGLPWVACGLLAVAVCAVYGRSLDAPFIFDDVLSVVNNPSITKLFPLFGGPPGTSPLSAPKGDMTAGRPVVNLSLAVNYYFGGLNPLGYHVFNMVVHIVSAMLLWASLRRSLRLEYFNGKFDRAANPLAFLVALVWALHPLVTEAVQYVTQRTELMMGMFYLATMYASLRYFTAAAPGEKTVWCALASLACLLGMACKEVMVTAPVMVLCFERTFIAGSFRKALERSWHLYLGLALGWLLLLALNYNAPRGNSAGFRDDVPFYAYWLTQAKVLEMYLKLTFWPWPLVIYHQVPVVVAPALVWPSLLVVAVLVLNTLMRFWQRKATGYLGAWVFIALSPTLVVPMFPEIAAERRMYLPLAAIVVLVIIGGYALLQMAGPRRKTEAPTKSTSPWPLAITAGCALIVAGVLATASARRLTAYDSRLSIWQDALVHEPDNSVAQAAVAYALLLAGREQEANEYFERALPMNPVRIQRRWGLGLMEVGQPQKAIKHFEELIRLEPNVAEHHKHLGAALVDAGRPQEAIKHLKRALALEPDAATARQQLADVIADARRANEAIERFRNAVQNQPDSAQLHFDLGTALFENGQLDEAIAKFEQALRLQADFPAAKLKLEQAVGARKR
jgi:tetratricopeptide (TPR) repeat protein